MTKNRIFDSPALAAEFSNAAFSTNENQRCIFDAYSYILALVFLGVLLGSAEAACRKGALGTSRTIVIDAAKHRTITGSDSALGLRPKEVVLTFDDGPIAGKTSSILRSLKKECVKATFFYVGKMARAYPKLVRAVVKQGHTLAHHTHDHDRLPDFSIPQASRLIDRGIRGVQKIAYGDASSTPRTPFFRYPYLARTKKTDGILARKGMVAFGANINSLDWKPSSPKQVHDRIMRRLRKEGKGIILMHDIQTRTAKMLPLLLRSLNSGGYRVVHIVAKQNGKPNSKQHRVPVANKKTKPSAKPIVVAAVELPKKPRVAKASKAPSVSQASKVVKSAPAARSSKVAKLKKTGFRYLNNRQLGKMSEKAQTRYWTRYWYVKRGRRIPKHLR